MATTNDPKLERVRSRIADLLVESEGFFNTPMRIMYIAVDPSNEEASLLLTNAPAEGKDTLRVAAKLLGG